MKDKEIKQFRKEVIETLPDIPVRLVLKYRMTIGGNILHINSRWSQVTVNVDDISAINNDRFTCTIRKGNSWIMLWTKYSNDTFDVAL